MNWTTFRIGMTALYGLYYALNLLYDLLIRPRRRQAGQDEWVLNSDSAPPEVISLGAKDDIEPIGSRRHLSVPQAPVISRTNQPAEAVIARPKRNH